MSPHEPEATPNSNRSDLDYHRRVEALREAVQVGIADFDASAFTSFDTAKSLSAHLAALTDEVLGCLLECAA